MSLPIPDRPAPPADALPLREAGAMCDRSLSTLRGWIRDGRLTGYRGAGENPANAPVLVSLAELRAVLVTSGAEVAPARPPAGPRLADPEARALAELRAELVTVRGALAVAVAEREGAQSTVDALRVALDMGRQRAAELARSLDMERARVVGLEAELAALRGAARLPWWRRLLPMVTGAPATLPDPTVTGSTGGADTP